MSDGNVMRIYDGLPSYGRALVIVGGLGVIAWTGFMVYNGIDRRIKNKKATEKANETLRATGGALADLSAKGVHPSFSDAQYKVWADQLEACFQGWGTCYVYKDVFESLKNDADVVRLIQAYGVRTISSGKWNPTPDYVGGLSGILTEELNSLEVIGLMNRMEERGIKFKILG